VWSPFSEMVNIRKTMSAVVLGLGIEVSQGFASLVNEPF